MDLISQGQREREREGERDIERERQKERDRERESANSLKTSEIFGKKSLKKKTIKKQHFNYMKKGQNLSKNQGNIDFP